MISRLQKLRCRTMLVMWTISALFAVHALADSGADIAAPEEHRRGEDQTYLTYPEWFLVHSPAEYARFVAREAPSEFPFFGHIGQFWDSYRTMTAAMGSAYEFNFGYHVMVFVIGTSTTVEYALKAGYEVVFGRWFETDEMTPEDRLGAFVAQDYVDFILASPWYEYDFFAQLRALWQETPLWGPHPLRKWERRFALTTEYAVKAGYAVLIEKMTRAGYEAPLPVTTILLTAPAPELNALPDLQRLADLADGAQLVTVPRYALFKDYAMSLARNGAEFAEIAGNRNIIVVSLLTNGAWTGTAVPYDVLLEQQILTEPGRKRQVVRTRVADLAEFLRTLPTTGVTVEHIYDY